MAGVTCYIIQTVGVSSHIIQTAGVTSCVKRSVCPTTPKLVVCPTSSSSKRPVCPVTLFIRLVCPVTLKESVWPVTLLNSWWGQPRYLSGWCVHTSKRSVCPVTLFKRPVCPATSFKWPVFPHHIKTVCVCWPRFLNSQCDHQHYLNCRCVQ